MSDTALETVNITLGLNSHPKIGPLLERMTHVPRLAVNIVRGRVTANEATYELQLKGSPRSVSQALRSCRGDGIAIRTEDPAASEVK